MKKVILRGFFYKNLGDDLFYHMIVERYPKCKFYLPVNSKYKDAYINKKNVKILSLNIFIRVINKLFKKMNNLLDIYTLIELFGDIVILVGGSLFQENSEDESYINNLDGMPGKRIPVYVLGINFGPYKTQKYLNKSTEYFEKAKDVCFRDSISYNLFKDLNNTRLATDIIFAIEELIPKKIEKEKLCIISVIDFSQNHKISKYKQIYINFILKAIENYSLKGYKIMLMSFCEMQGDEKAIREILDICPNKYKKDIIIHKYDGINWRETVEIISSASYIIATRFHSMILGFVYNIPTLPIIYNEKTFNMLIDLKCEDYCIHPKELDNYNFENIKFAQIKNIDILKLKAIEQFKIIDNILS